jgi:hypothetical protein
MDCSTEENFGFISCNGDGLLFLQNVKIGSEAHAVPYPMDTRELLH